MFIISIVTEMRYFSLFLKMIYKIMSLILTADAIIIAAKRNKSHSLPSSLFHPSDADGHVSMVILLVVVMASILI